MINSDTLVLRDGGVLGSSGILGSVGNIKINAAKYIEITGFQPTVLIPSNIISTNTSSLTPGSINITTSNLYIRDGANISTSTFGGGSAGSIFIDVNNLEITGKVPSSISSDSEILSSISSSTAKLSSRFRELLPERIDIGDFVNSPLEGDSGNIEVKANSVKIEHSGQINVSNFGTGDGGEIALNANSIELDDGGGITASTSSGEGGNITLNTDNLSLLNQAQITASAGGAGNGGNININSDTILGLNNSDITANAVAGNGGNINIESEAVIGLEARSQLTPFNDITASSELGIDGTVRISSPENNSNEDLIISAKEVGIYQDQELFSDGCNNRNGKGMKIAYLNSGSPESPDDFFDDEEPLPLSEDSDSITSSASELDLENAVPPLWSQGDPVVEGNMIQTNSDGSVYFVAVDKEKTVESMVCTQDAESFF